MKIKDRNRFQDYLDPLPDAPDTDFGTIVSDLALTRNDMFGGQIGFRYFKSRDRFTFSTDFKAFAGGSWQASRSQRTIIDLELFDFEQGLNGEGPPDGIRQVPVNYSPPILSRNDEAFIGFDIHTELAYQVSRYVTIRAGVQVIDVARGVWRGGDGPAWFTRGWRSKPGHIYGRWNIWAVPEPRAARPDKLSRRKKWHRKVQLYDANSIVIVCWPTSFGHRSSRRFTATGKPI